MGRRIKTYLLFCLTTAHFLFLGLLLFCPPPKKAPKPLAVRTRTPQPLLARATPPAAVVPASTPKPPVLATKTPAPPPTPRPQTIPSKTLQPKAPVPIKKTPPTSPTPPPTLRPQVSDALLKELEKSIAQIDAKPTPTPPSKTQKSFPAQPLALQIDSLFVDADSKTIDQLISTLQNQLRLPEQGEVKVELTLHREGKVVKVVILETKSEKNKAYLTSQLLNLRFPPLKEMAPDKKEEVFTLTFCNA